MLWQSMQARHASPVGLYFGVTIPAADFADVGAKWRSVKARKQFYAV